MITRNGHEDQAYARAARSGQVDIEPVDLVFGDSDERSGRFYFSATPAIDGEDVSVIVHAIDTTEQRALELQFAQSQKMQAVGQLAGGIAHDFNNVLTAIIGFSELLLANHRPTDPAFQDIMNIKQNANRAAGLVRQLLAFSRQQRLRPQVLSLSDVLADLTILLERLLSEKTKLELQHGRDLWLMHNGPRLPVPILEDDKSDTWHFVKHMLYPILENNPDFIENDDFIRMLDRIIGSEKLLLLDSHVGFIRVNENAGTKKDNMWLSNTYSLGRDKGMNYNVHTGKVVPSKAPVTNLYGNKGKSLVPYGNRNWIEADYVGDDDDYLYPELGHNWGKVADYSTKADRLEVIGNSTLPDLYGDPAPVSTEEILDAYTSNTLYEFALDNLEGLVSWLRQTIKLPKAS